MTEIGEDEGILRNDFAMAQRLTVQPHEGVAYLPEASREWTENLGEHLGCVVCSITEVRTVTEEAVAIRVVSQVGVAVSTTSMGRMVMQKAGPGPLGLCLV